MSAHVVLRPTHPPALSPLVLPVGLENGHPNDEGGLKECSNGTTEKKYPLGMKGARLSFVWLERQDPRPSVSWK